MRFRTVLEEFEAHFHSIQPGTRVRGKSEWKRYEDGTCRFKLSVLYLTENDASHVDLWRDGSWLMRLPVQNGKAKIDLESDSNSDIPVIEAGQVVQIRSGETVLAEGTYKVE